jgi:hypothetical protein
VLFAGIDYDHGNDHEYGRLAEFHDRLGGRHFRSEAPLNSDRGFPQQIKKTPSRKENDAFIKGLAALIARSPTTRGRSQNHA